MWIFTEDGFLSVVRHRHFPDRLLVRARVREDLVRFCRAAAIPEDGILESGRYDYRFRVEVPEEVFIRSMVQTIKMLDYDNFKNRACHNPDDPPAVRRERASAYHGVWHQLWELQRSAARERREEAL
ncbi:MAG: hypothetical protein WHS86_09910 [Desulfosoma sp.]